MQNGGKFKCRLKMVGELRGELALINASASDYCCSTLKFWCYILFQLGKSLVKCFVKRTVTEPA